MRFSGKGFALVLVVSLTATGLWAAGDADTEPAVAASSARSKTGSGRPEEEYIKQAISRRRRVSLIGAWINGKNPFIPIVFRR